MNIEEKTLLAERDVLKKDLDNLNNNIVKVEKDLVTMKGNLNAIYGAIQQVDKLIKLTEGNKMPDEKEKALNIATG